MDKISITKYRSLLLLISVICMVSLIAGILCVGSYTNTGGKQPALAATYDYIAESLTHTGKKYNATAHLAVYADVTFGTLDGVECVEGSGNNVVLTTGGGLVLWTEGKFTYTPHTSWSSTAPTSMEVRYLTSSDGTYTSTASMWTAIRSGTYSTKNFTREDNNFYSNSEKSNVVIASSGVNSWNMASSSETQYSVYYLVLQSSYFTGVYTLTYDANGGSVSTSSRVVLYNYTNVTTPSASRTGYTFNGWYIGNTKYTGGIWTYNSNKTATASWTPKTYYVQYQGNGATEGSMINSTHTYDTSAALRSNSYIRTGYSFAGWAKTSTGSVVYADQDSVKNLTSTANATVSLYAIWTPNTYTVKYNANGGSGTMSDSTHTYDTASSLRTSTFTRTGYTFIGWSTNSNNVTADYEDGESVSTLAPSGTVTLYAIWQGFTYYVKYDANGGVGSMDNSAHTYGIASMLSANEFTKEGYVFAGWANSPNGVIEYLNKDTIINLTQTAGETVTIYAVWSLDVIVVTFSYNGATNGNGLINKNVILDDPYGDLPLPSKIGASFGGWYSDPNLTTEVTNNTTVTNSDDHTLYAKWLTWLTVNVTGTSTTVGYESTINEVSRDAKVYVMPSAGQYISRFSFDNVTYFDVAYTKYDITNLDMAISATYTATMASNVFMIEWEFIYPDYFENSGAITLYLVTTNTQYSGLRAGGGAGVSGVAVSATKGGSVTILGDSYDDLEDEDIITVKADICLVGYKFDGWYYADNLSNCLSMEMSEKFKKSDVYQSQLVAVFSPIEDNTSINQDTSN